MNCRWSFNISLLQTNPIIINFTSGGGGGREGHPYERVGMIVEKLELRPKKGSKGDKSGCGSSFFDH